MHGMCVCVCVMLVRCAFCIYNRDNIREILFMLRVKHFYTSKYNYNILTKNSRQTTFYFLCAVLDYIKVRKLQYDDAAVGFN